MGSFWPQASPLQQPRKPLEHDWKKPVPGGQTVGSSDRLVTEGGQIGSFWPQASDLQQPRKPFEQDWKKPVPGGQTVSSRLASLVSGQTPASPVQASDLQHPTKPLEQFWKKPVPGAHSPVGRSVEVAWAVVVAVAVSQASSSPPTVGLATTGASGSVMKTRSQVLGAKSRHHFASQGSSEQYPRKPFLPQT